MDHSFYSLAISLIYRLGPLKYKELVSKFNTPVNAWIELTEIKENLSFKISFDKKQLIKQTEKTIEWLTKNNIEYISLWDNNYPVLLKEIYTPPAVLFYKGDLDKLYKTCIGIVGTRRPTSYGSKATNMIARQLASAGINIISGLASGIDTIAHKAALQEGDTTAVLPTGFDKIYPTGNTKLVDEITEKSLVITEIPPFYTIKTGNFYQRNRIIAGLSRAVIITEAPKKSGALITANFALEENREIYALPGPIDSQKSEGCNNLLKNGANIFTDTDSFLEDINFNGKSNNNIIDIVSLNEEEIIVLEEIGDSNTHIDDILRKTGLNFGKVSSVLFNLEYKEIITEIPGGYYQKTGLYNVK